VRDAERFPTPVNPVGSLASVTSTIVNDGGTMLCTRKLDEILGLEYGEEGRQIVRVQAGCRLKKLNLWLQAHALEVPFQAEIGEATVGSVAVGDTKESSLDAPGYFSAHVVGLTYVDDEGELKTLTERDGPAFDEFKCSFGLCGIVVECQVEVRPATLCRSEVSIAGFGSPEDLAAGLVRMRDGCDALFAIVLLHQLASFCDQRHRAGPGAATPASSQPACDEFRLAKRLVIQRGFDGVAAPPQPTGLVYSRADFVNEYWRPTADERRLDFQYYEHDLNGIERVVVETFRFVKAFEAETGFAPKGWATYFVNRPEKGKKPFGIYSAGPGVSFSFDPFCGTPTDPLWQRFAREYNRLALDTLGGNASPIQTQWLEPQDVTIPAKLARRRFTTKYYEPFLGRG
jgi:FAD/FMN-containing dehydrogenase